ncbi:MAG: DUF4388 domain-containing protein [Acidobacteria bacterium]|nr:MAG: DUF4388 domain-containing protein [Acidobacteriota bacterium]
MASRTLLIVESPGVDSGRYRALARSAGFKVLTANGGAITTSFIRRAQPALVFVSPHTKSPGPSEIARGIKEDPETADIPVLILVPTERARKTAYPTEACATVDASDEELLTTMRLLARNPRQVRYSRPPTSPLEGNLDESFPDVLQFLFTAQKTGRVTVQNGARTGRIYIESGNVVHAEHAERDGTEAFRRLCFSTRGKFKFEPGFRTYRRTIAAGGIQLLLESARVKDERARAGPGVGPGVGDVKLSRLRQTTFPSLERPRQTTFSRWIANISRVLGH